MYNIEYVNEKVRKECIRICFTSYCSVQLFAYGPLARIATYNPMDPSLGGIIGGCGGGGA